MIREPGAVFGELCVLNNKTWPGEARAKSESIVLEVRFSVGFECREMGGTSLLSCVPHQLQGLA